jgi:methionine synthase II (cobalamin-independent)
MATGVGSMPHTDVGKACEVIIKNFPEAPYWPQLPRLSFKENMYIQYSEGCPGIVMKEDAEGIYIDTSQNFFEEIGKFYQKYLDNDIDAFAISEEYAQGLRMTLELIKGSYLEGIQLIKGQITGPISFGLTVTDDQKKSIIYHEAAADVIVKLLAMKAKWLEKTFHEILPDIPAIIFFDEPYMVSFGSAFFNFSRSQVIRCLSECIEGVAGITGVHCCGNTDWSVITDTKVDVINFDAYGYAESLALYPKEIKDFLDRGGILAWGIVPTSDAIEGETVESLVKRLEAAMQLLVDQGISKPILVESAFITTSCGMGLMPVKQAERAIKLTKEVSEAMKEEYF